jgi:hypothetical protein
MDDEASKSLRERLDALLRRAREISAEIERRVEEVTTEDATSSPAPTQARKAAATPEHLEAAKEAIEVAAEAVAVSAEAAAVTAEALSTIANETGAAPASGEPHPPTTVVPEAAAAVANEATTGSDAAVLPVEARVAASSVPAATEGSPAPRDEGKTEGDKTDDGKPR